MYLRFCNQHLPSLTDAFNLHTGLIHIISCHVVFYMLYIFSFYFKHQTLPSVQCIDMKKKCDGFHDCMMGSDEKHCHNLGHVFSEINPPAVINFNRLGRFTVTSLQSNNTQCPDSHFQCHDDGYCLPVYVRCNGMIDCPGHEDEAACDNYKACPGFYRCRGSDKVICLHINHLCDGMPQCPKHDDELICHVTCPKSCVCFGFAFSCNHSFFVSSFQYLRYLEISGSEMNMNEVINATMLIHLGVVACGWTNLTDVHLPNLHSLDLRDNLLHSVNFSHFLGMPQLRRLNLAGNPMSDRIYGQTLLSLLIFNISHVQANSVNMGTLSTLMPNIENVDLSWSNIETLQGQALLHCISVFTLKGCTITDFTPDFMKHMTNLVYVSADNFKLCCSVVLPDNFRGQCLAPSDEISSCNDLLKSMAYRCALGFFAALAVLGNFSGFVYRIFYSSESKKTGFTVFVLHLCASDYLMGVYLVFIGVADRIYTGSYLWNDIEWKQSTACSIAGFFCLLSSEASALLISLITLDRFLVLRFPFSHIRFGARSAHIACVITWGLGFTLGVMPLLPITSHWEFYRQTGICIPLPVTRAHFPGRIYSFGIMIVCNLILFLMIGVGQCLIYWTVMSNAMSNPLTNTKDIVTETAKSKEATIARRLLSIAVSDFLCWFPVGLCGVLATSGVVIPGEINVGLAIFVLPLNSALNPFLYTLNIILEKRRKGQELRFQKMLRSQQKQ